MWLGATNRSITNPQQPVLSVGFSPQPNYGFSVTGTPAFDQQFTITNNTNPFGATGPTLVMFDDFRSGTVGVPIPDNTPGVAGSSIWLHGLAFGGFGNAVIQSPNRSGAGNCIRIHKSTGGDLDCESLELAFASTQGIYIFWAENTHGFDFSTQTGQGTGNNFNYKMHWATQNTHTGGAFNEWLPAVLGSPGPPPSTGGQNIQSNNSPPLPGPFLPNSTIWDPNNWNSAEIGYVGTDSATGIIMLSVYNPTTTRAGKTTGRFLYTNTTQTLFSNTTGANGDYDTMNHLSVPGLIQGFVSGFNIDRADYYVAIGPQAMCRFFIGDASTITNCTTIMPCDIVSWAPGSVTMNLRRGAFASPGGNYLYWSDANNNISLAGQFTFGFDFFISPTGNDSNPGTLASPWALTALSSHSEIQGKRVGLLPGTYIVGGSGLGGWTQALSQGGPSAAQPTYIQSTTPLGAVITQNNGGTYPQSTACMFGVTADNITLDGIKFYQGVEGGVHVVANNCTIKNCHLEDFDLTRYTTYSAANPGDNVAAISSESSATPFSNLLVSNCVIKHVRNANSASGGGQAINSSGLILYSLYDTIVEYCTITDVNSAVHYKTASGITVRNCFLYLLPTPHNDTRPLVGCTTYNNAGTIPQTKHPSFLYNNVCFGNQQVVGGSNNASQTDVTMYNNTFILGAQAGPYATQSEYNDVSPTSSNQSAWKGNFYNNIWYNTTATVPVYVFATGTGAPTTPSVFSGQVLDYNNYFYTNVGNFSVVDHVGNITYTTLASWAAFVGAEAHSNTSNPTFVNASGTSAASFQLQATSPLKNAGRIGGVSTGAATDFGAWGGNDFHTGVAITQIGSTIS